MKKKGFTLIELLVVIAIIAMLLAILMPALGKVKRMAQRIVCATNLKGMGTAHMTYGLDYDDEFAVQGGKGDHTWAAKTTGWKWAGNPDVKNWSDDGDITVAASLYLLVREADVSPASFICKSSGDKEFSPIDFGVSDDLTELWDFGDNPGGMGDETPTVSYAYQQPYRNPDTAGGSSSPASGTGNPANAIMADRNPWSDNDLEMTNGGADQKTFEGFVDQLRPDAQKWETNIANSASHSRDGQNVLFGDGHVEFTRTPATGYEKDNIYTRWMENTDGNTGANDGSYNDIRVGDRMGPMWTKGYSRGSTDSCLVNDNSKK